MIGKLFRGKPAAAAVPDGMRVYAVGDIHGCDALLDRLLDMISAETTAVTPQFIFLGDYVDRGSGSKAVIDCLLVLKEAHSGAVFLKGNHEQAMLDFLVSPSRNEEWLHWGGDKTLESYGVSGIWKKDAEFLGQELEDRLPGEHLDFLKSLDLWKAVGDYAFVHAGFRPGVPLDDQSEEDCLWIRGEFHNAAADARPDKIVVHGHHPVRKPLDAGWRIDVDTGAVWSDALTAVVLEGTARRFISTGKF
jgi:serine/threonine protein phosphatase 1